MIFLQYQGLKLQLNSSTVIYKDQIIELSKNEMRILYTLLQHKESIVSRDQLMESLWQSNEFIDDNTLTVNVNRVRKKLEAAGLKRFYKNKKRAGLYDMKTKDFFRMEYAQILIYIVFLGLLEVLLFIFEVNYFLMIYCC